MQGTAIRTDSGTMLYHEATNLSLLKRKKNKSKDKNKVFEIKKGDFLGPNSPF